MEELDKTIYNEFEQSLIDAGYHFFTDNWKHSIRGIQKRFEDKKGTKYFIKLKAKKPIRHEVRMG